MDFKKAIDYVVWVKKSEEKSKWTIRDYRSKVGEFAEYMEKKGVKSIHDVKAKDIREYISSLDDRGLANTTINIKLRNIRAFYNVLIGDGMASENPMDGIKLRKEKSGHIRPLSDKDIEALLKMPNQKTFIGKRNYVCMLVMLGTGIRPSELLALHVDDWHEMHIIVREEIAKDGRQRILPLSMGLIKEMFKYEQMREDWGGKLLFPSQEGTRLSTHGLYQALKKYARKAGIDESLITPYAFRHTFATNFLRAGGGEFRLQKILGHSGLEMTKRYVELSGRDLQEQIDDFSPAEKFLQRKGKTKRRRI